MEELKQNSGDNINLSFKVDIMHDHFNVKNEELHRKFIDLSTHVKKVNVQVAQIAEVMLSSMKS